MTEILDFAAWRTDDIETLRAIMPHGYMRVVDLPIEIVPAFTAEQLQSGDTAQPKGKAAKMRDMTDQELADWYDDVERVIAPYCQGYIQEPQMRIGDKIVHVEFVSAHSLGAIADILGEADGDVYLYGIFMSEAWSEGKVNRVYGVRFCEYRSAKDMDTESTHLYK